MIQILQVVQIIASLATILVAMRTLTKVEQVHIATNSLTDKLVAATALASEARGRVLERKEMDANEALKAAGKEEQRLKDQEP